jgi:hypothetical protein
MGRISPAVCRRISGTSGTGVGVVWDARRSGKAPSVSQENEAVDRDTLVRSMQRLRLRFAFFALVLGAAAACGSRTGLFTDEEAFGPNPIDGGDARDGGRRDGARDGEPEEDALPPIDARPPVDVIRTDCPDADATLIYVITTSYELFSFNPPDGAFKFIGNIACPAQINATPFSMAVDRKGTAFILFNDENLYRVSTLNAACVGTTYVPRQFGYGVFGMGFATNSIGPTETLFIAGDDRTAGSDGLARIDPTTFALTPVDDFFPSIRFAELTGTGDGRLFAYYRKSGVRGIPSYIGEIDTTNANVIAEKRLDTVDQGQGWAFAFWGGDFYIFHAPGGGSVVTRYRPADDSVVQVATLPTIIVGAGVSTCAPQ